MAFNRGKRGNDPSDLKTNSYYKHINVIQKIAIARSRFIIKKVSLDSSLALLIIVLLLILGIVSIAHAELKPREWPANQSRFK